MVDCFSVFIVRTFNENCKHYSLKCRVKNIDRVTIVISSFVFWRKKDVIQVCNFIYFTEALAGGAVTGGYGQF